MTMTASAAVRERTVTARNLTSHVLLAGDPAQPAVLLLHGAGPGACPGWRWSWPSSWAGLYAGRA